MSMSFRHGPKISYLINNKNHHHIRRTDLRSGAGDSRGCAGTHRHRPLCCRLLSTHHPGQLACPSDVYRGKQSDCPNRDVALLNLMHDLKDSYGGNEIWMLNDEAIHDLAQSYGEMIEIDICMN